MPSFTKDDLLEEVRAIIAAAAATIAALKSPKAAGEFLGIEDEVYGFDCSPKDVSPDEYGAFGMMSDAFDYAFSPNLTHDEGAVSDLITDVRSIVRCAYYEGISLNPFLQTRTSYSETVLQTILARAKLDFEDSPLFIEEVAYLADMGVASVRNAAKGNSPNVLKTYNLGKRTVIDREEAIRWLSGRRGYVHSPIHNAATVGAGDILSAQSVTHLGKLLTLLREHLNRSQSDLAADLGWSVEKLSSWETGTYELNLEDSKALAKALDIDPVMFVPKVVELGLRRDGGS